MGFAIGGTTVTGLAIGATPITGFGIGANVINFSEWAATGGAQQITITRMPTGTAPSVTGGTEKATIGTAPGISDGSDVILRTVGSPITAATIHDETGLGLTITGLSVAEYEWGRVTWEEGQADVVSSAPPPPALTISDPTGYSGGTSQRYIPEGETVIGTYTANRVVNWALSGDDADKFTIPAGASSSVAVSFASAPDFETPTDFNLDNRYDAYLNASDPGTGDATYQIIRAFVTDVAETAPRAVIENPVIVILGSSLMEHSFGKNLTTPNADVTKMFADLGVVNPTVYGYGHAGDTTAQITGHLAEAQAAFPNGYFFFEPGANDIIQTYPYSTRTQAEIDSFNSAMSGLWTQANTTPGRVFVSTAMFMNFSGTTFATPSNGSEPYNANVIIPGIEANLPHAMAKDGRPWLDLYRWSIENHERILDTDNVHHTLSGKTALRIFMAERMAPYFTGAPLAETIPLRVHPAGPQAAPAGSLAVGEHVDFVFDTTGFIGPNVRTPAKMPMTGYLKKPDGSSSGITYTFSTTGGGTYNNETLGAAGYGANQSGRGFNTPAGYDGTLYNEYVIRHNLFIEKNATFVAQHNDLPAGTYEFSFVSSRSNGTARTNLITMDTGETTTWDSSKSTPELPKTITTTASGSKTFTLSAQTGDYAYLSGYRIKRIA